MQILAVTQIVQDATDEQIKSLEQAEAVRGMELGKAGFIQVGYMRQDTRGAVMILESASLEDATQQLNTLPLAKAGLLQFNLIPIRAANES